MELDDLKVLWNDTAHRVATLEPALRMHVRLAAAGARDRTRAKLRLVRLVLWYEAGFAGLTLLLNGPYLFEQRAEARFAIPAAALQLIAIVLLAYAGRQLVLLQEIDFTGPVVAIQRALAEVAVVRARTNRALLLAAPLLWAVLLVIVPHGLLGFDVYRAFGGPWVTANLVFGVAVVAAVAWATRRFPATVGSVGFLHAIGDDFTGRRVAEASRDLDDVRRFEVEG